MRRLSDAQGAGRAGPAGGHFVGNPRRAPSAFSRGYLAVQLVVCLLFLCDFFIRWRLAGRKGLFLLRNLFFLLISIPYLNIAVWSHAQLPRYWEMLLGLMPLIRAFGVLGIVGALARDGAHPPALRLLPLHRAGLHLPLGAGLLRL